MNHSLTDEHFAGSLRYGAILASRTATIVWFFIYKIHII